MTEYRTRIPWVDNLLDLEVLRGPERRSNAIEPVLNLGEVGIIVLCFREFCLVGHFNAAFNRERTPVTGGPGVAKVVTAGLIIGATGYPKCLADDDTAKGNG